MLLETGTTVLVAHRRLFENDRSRFFVGRVDAYEGGIARITGYTWIQDGFTGALIGRIDGPRTKLISLSSGALLVYALPTIAPDAIQFKHDAKGRLWLTDGAEFRLELSEGFHGKFPT